MHHLDGNSANWSCRAAARSWSGHEGIDNVTRDLRAGRRHGGAGAAGLQTRQQHLHGREIARMAGPIDLDNQPGYSREVTRALLDELHAREPGERDGIGDRRVGAWPGVEIKRDRKIGLAFDRLSRSDQPAWAAPRRDAAAPSCTAAAPGLGEVASSTEVLNDGCVMPTMTGTRRSTNSMVEGRLLIKAEIGPASAAATAMVAPRSLTVVDLAQRV